MEQRKWNANPSLVLPSMSFSSLSSASSTPFLWSSTATTIAMFQKQQQQQRRRRQSQPQPSYMNAKAVHKMMNEPNQFRKLQEELRGQKCFTNAHLRAKFDVLMQTRMEEMQRNRTLHTEQKMQQRKQWELYRQQQQQQQHDDDDDDDSDIEEVISDDDDDDHGNTMEVYGNDDDDDEEMRERRIIVSSRRSLNVPSNQNPKPVVIQIKRNHAHPHHSPPPCSTPVLKDCPSVHVVQNDEDSNIEAEEQEEEVISDDDDDDEQ